MARLKVPYGRLLPTRQVWDGEIVKQGKVRVVWLDGVSEVEHEGSQSLVLFV